MQSKEYRLAVLEYDDEKNILFYRVKQDIVIDVPEIQEMITYVKEFVGEKRHFAVVDFGTRVGSSTAGRKIYAESEYIRKYRIADAFIVESLALRLIANFFINVTKPKITTRLFTSEKPAVAWLLSLRSKVPA